MLENLQRPGSLAVSSQSVIQCGDVSAPSDFSNPTPEALISRSGDFWGSMHLAFCNALGHLRPELGHDRACDLSAPYGCQLDRQLVNFSLEQGTPGNKHCNTKRYGSILAHIPYPSFATNPSPYTSTHDECTPSWKTCNGQGL